MKSLQVGWRKRDFLNFPCALQEENMLLLCSCDYPPAPPTAASCLPPAQPGRPSERQGGPAASGDRRQLRVPKAVTGCGAALEEQQWALYCGGVHRCGAGPGAGRGGRPWSGGRAGTAAPRLQIPVALRLPPPAGGGRNWPTVKFTYFDL